MDGVLVFFLLGSAAHHRGAVKIFSPHFFSHYTQQMSVVIFCTAGIDGTLARWIQITATSTQTVTDGGRPPGSESDSGHPRPPPPPAVLTCCSLLTLSDGRDVQRGPSLNRRPPLTGGCSREKVSAPPRPPSPSPSKTRSRAVLRAH